MTRCGQEVLERTACEITEQGITVRFFGRISGKWTYYKCGRTGEIFFEFLPVCVEKAFVYRNLSGKRSGKYYFPGRKIRQYIQGKKLKKRSLVAFVNDGAILPKREWYFI